MHMLQKRCLRLCGRVEVDSGNKSRHNTVYGSRVCVILVRLGDLEGKSI